MPTSGRNVFIFTDFFDVLSEMNHVFFDILVNLLQKLSRKPFRFETMEKLIKLN